MATIPAKPKLDPNWLSVEIFELRSSGRVTCFPEAGAPVFQPTAPSVLAAGR
jgi:hypothetical protein